MELVSDSIPCVMGQTLSYGNYSLVVGVVVCVGGCVVCVGGCVVCGGVQPPGRVVNGGQGELLL